jgi:hypothetical protein
VQQSGAAWQIKFWKNAALQRNSGWPQQAVARIAGTIVLFVAGYVVFQRQEVRA